MKAKPKAAKYRNLRARGGLIQYRRMVAGKLVRFSTNTDVWDAAAAGSAPPRSAASRSLVRDTAF